MSDRTRLLFFTKGAAINPASRYRFLQYIPHLKREGFACTVRPLLPEAYYTLSARTKSARLIAKAGLSSSAFARRLLDLPKARRADLVVIENQLFPYEQGALERLLRPLARRMVVEFDDAIYLTRFHDAKMRRVMRMADHVIVGNATLAEVAVRANPCVSVVPTVIDMDRYPRVAERERDAGPLRIGWIGLPSTLPYLISVRAALARLAAVRDIELVVISSETPRMDGVPIRFVPWSEAHEAAELARLDIGIMPLPDDLWTRGKCGAKLLQYMAAARAAVASPVGVNREIVTHGENGFLASSNDDWFEALLALCDDPALRAAFGEAGRRTVEERYSLQTWAPRVAALYREIIES